MEALLTVHLSTKKSLGMASHLLVLHGSCSAVLSPNIHIDKDHMKLSVRKSLYTINMATLRPEIFMYLNNMFLRYYNCSSSRISRRDRVDLSSQILFS